LRVRVLFMESGFACKMSQRMTAFHPAEDRNLEVGNKGLLRNESEAPILI
jgi:hypothetical protein